MPVTVLYLYGGSLIFVASLATIHMAIWTAVFLHRGQHVRFAWVTSVMRGSIVAAILGTLLIIGARDIWRRRWLRGTIEVSAAIMTYAVFAAIGGRLIGI